MKMRQASVMGSLVLACAGSGFAQAANQTPEQPSLFARSPSELMNVPILTRARNRDEVLLGHPATAYNSARTIGIRGLSGPLTQRYPLPNGRILDLAFHPILKNDNVLGISAFGKDITARKLAKAALIASEKHVHDALEYQPISIGVTIGPDIVRFHQPFVNTFGYTVSDVPTLDAWTNRAYPDPEYRRQVLANWESDVAYAVEHDVRTPPGECGITCKDGCEATWRIPALEIELGCPHAVILAITASVFDQDREAVLGAGCDDILHKPFREGELFDALAHHAGVAFLLDAETAPDTRGKRPLGLEPLNPIWRTDFGGRLRAGDVQRAWALVDPLPASQGPLRAYLQQALQDDLLDDLECLFFPRET